MDEFDDFNMKENSDCEDPSLLFLNLKKFKDHSYTKPDLKYIAHMLSNIHL